MLAKGDVDGWYRLTPEEDIKHWLCDALRGNPPHADCLRWWERHKRHDDQEREAT
jgi:hypothetical protein